MAELLMSMYPKYIKKIVSKEKEYEFRNIILSDSQNIFWIYITKPEKKVAFKMIVSKAIVKNESNDDIFLRSRSGNYGVAYKIISLYQMAEFVELSKLKEKFGVYAPQGYLYLQNYPILEKHLNKIKLIKIF